ncbi:MAG: chorismate mutase [Bacteroidota bacterium]
MKKNLLSWFNQTEKPLLIAGPCSAESPAQLLNTAKGIAVNYPNAVFRAGIWKPRTRPGSFEGKGEEALLWLKAMSDETGLRTAVEVATPSHIELALKHGVNMLWVGARTVVNPFSVQELADALTGIKDIPVLVKNPIHPDVNLWIGALERIQNAGVTQLGAVHRGFHMHGKSQFRNDPAWEIPIQLKTQMPDLPLFCDPSHIAGNRTLLAFIAQRAMDLDMDGLMIETHCTPDLALSDAKQQITPETLHALIQSLRIGQSEHEMLGEHDELQSLRNRIDAIDDELIQLLAQRMGFSKQIGKFKQEHNVTILQIRRWKNTLKNQIKNGSALGLSENFIKAIYQIVHDESISVQSSWNEFKKEKKEISKK